MATRFAALTVNRNIRYDLLGEPIQLQYDWLALRRPAVGAAYAILGEEIMMASDINVVLAQVSRRHRYEPLLVFDLLEHAFPMPRNYP